MLVPKSVEEKAAPVVERIRKQIDDFCQETGDIEDVKEFFINQLLDGYGYMPSRCKKRTPKLVIPDDIIKLIKEKEKKLKIKLIEINSNKTVTVRRRSCKAKKDESEAQYMIETALIEIGQYRADARYTKSNIDRLLGYCEKSMYNQRDIYKEIIKTENSEENKLYTQLRRELESLTAQI